MTVTKVEKDLTTRTLTITAEYDAPPSRVWGLWADPRQLERWWGPPSYATTIVEHDLRPGKTVSYVTTSPEGEQRSGCWE